MLVSIIMPYFRKKITNNFTLPVFVLLNDLTLFFFECLPLFSGFRAVWFDCGATLWAILNLRAFFIAKIQPRSNIITFILCSLNRCVKGTNVFAVIRFQMKVRFAQIFGFISGHNICVKTMRPIMRLKLSIIHVVLCIMCTISRFRLRSSIERSVTAKSPSLRRSIVIRSSFLSKKIGDIIH